MSRTRRTSLWLLGLTGLGVASKFYEGPLGDWVRGSLGGILYVVFWIGVLTLIRPSGRIEFGAITVTLITCALETLQLWKPAPLQAIRGTWIGHALLGNTFAVTDFAYYLVGGIVGWAVFRRPSTVATDAANRAP